MNSVKKTTRALVILPAMLVAISVAGSAFAQSIIEEIIVTATKRESTIQDVPFSINAQTQADIQRSGATDLEDISLNVASLTVQNLGPGQSQVAIRGVSAGQIVRDQPGVKEQVGVYFDESVISLSLFTPDLDLYDLNRVETLRGPQGTLFGSGSVGGTIRYISNQPNLEEFEGGLELDINTLTDGGTGGHLKGMVNMPFADGQAALRLVGYTTEYAGFIDARMESTGQFKSDVNSGNRSGIRATLAWSPNDNLTITPRIVYQEVEADGFNRQEVYNVFANPYTTTAGGRPPIQLGPREQHLLLDEQFTDETLLVDLVVEAGFDSFDLTFVGSVLDRDILVSRDASALTGSVSIDVLLEDAAVLLPSNLRDTTDMSQTTFELRASSNSDGAWQWLVGAFNSSVDRDYAQLLPTPGYDAAWDADPGDEGLCCSADAANGIAPPDSPFASSLPYEIDQTAIFGEVSYDFNDDFTLTAGGRWYDFDETRRIQFGGVFASATDQIDSTASDGFTPRILASWSMSDNVTFNAQASQGFRLGGVNDPLNAGLCSAEDLIVFGGFQSYGDETVWNYEAGIKSRYNNGVTLNAAVFYADMQDLQVTLDAGSCSSRISFNVADAHSSGVEFELSTNPGEAWQFSMAGSFLTSEFDSTVLDSTGEVLGGVAEGNRLASVPEIQLAATGSYYFPVSWGGGSDGYVSATIQYVGDRITQPSDQTPGAGTFTSGLAFGGATGDEVTEMDLLLDPYTIININAGLDFETWSATLYVHNVGDENANTSFDRERGGRARLSYRTNKPRTIGVVFRMGF